MTAPTGPAAARAAALLCETCGYLLGGLETAAACPECGRAVCDSLPGRRPGTPWQRRPALATWAGTNAAVLRHSGPLFADARMERPRSRWLARLNVALAGVLVAAGWAIQLLRLDSGPDVRLIEAAGTAAFALAIVAPIAAVLMWAGTWIEAQGIRFIGRRRGWRITRDVAWAVCGHASVGWTLAGLLWVGGALLSWAMGLTAMRSRPAPSVTVVICFSPWWPMLAGLFAGLMAFEVLVNIGVRRCRYTNPGG